MNKHTEQNQEINRRDFLKTMGVITAGTLLKRDRLSQNDFENEIMPASDLADTVNHKQYSFQTGEEQSVALRGVEQNEPDSAMMKAVKQAALAATDFAWLKKGDAVFIKPALNSGNAFPATTSPIAIKAMIELLIEKGAGRVIISDLSGIEHVKLSPDKLEGSSRQLMESCGMAQTALEAGGELYFPEEDGWDAFVEEFPREQTYWQGGIMMPAILQDVDHIVLMPRCSRHALLGSSLGLKCAVGYWRTDSRLEYHRDAASIQEKTADANTVPSLLDKQRLVISDASQMITTMGPDHGFIAKPETGLVIASEHIVAHDMVSLAWLLLNRLAMREEDYDEYRDPYTSQFLVQTINRFVVTRLGNLGDLFASEKLLRNDLGSIRDDRVLKRAYEIFGGMPQVNLHNLNDTVPEEILDSLNKLVVA